jgi:ferric-dicitrate binding protein FerR (iron transport regulator)
MRKFNFRKKKLSAKDQSLQEELVNQYFDKIDLGSLPETNHDGVEFNSDKVYNRITSAVDGAEKSAPAFNKNWLVAASLLAGLCFAAYIYRDTILNYVSPVAVKQVMAANGKIMNITLADGTRVWLNGGSKLIYPEKFRGDKREITLVGEAFLDVNHDTQRSFIVHTGNIRTQVLGTSFNVKAYPEDHFVKVDVLTGKVGVIGKAQNTKGSQTIFLTPAQEVMFNKDDNQAVKKEMVDVNVLTAWKNGEFVFKNMPLPEVLNSIEHRFNIKVSADINLVRCSISANFTNVSLVNIMKIMSKLVKGKAIQEGSGYRLKGKGC